LPDEHILQIMAYRLVRARPRESRLTELRERLDSGDIRELEPFGAAMTESLTNARFDPDAGEAVWVEEDYCSPPLRMEREVLEQYFDDVTVVEADVHETEGWDRIDDLPSLWESVRSTPG
jgi:hypothetical protein